MNLLKKTNLYFAILISVLTIILQCSPEKDIIESKSHLTEEQREELRQRRKYLNNLVKDSYDIQMFSSSKEEAVNNFLEAVRTEKPDEIKKHLITKEEYATMLWPNYPEKQTLDLGSAIEDRWVLISMRMNIGLADLKDLLGGRKKGSYKITEYNWKPEINNRGVFREHLLKSIKITVAGKEVINESITFVLEYKGMFKVAGLGR
jgi:hypothetical protein